MSILLELVKNGIFSPFVNSWDLKMDEEVKPIFMQNSSGPPGIMIFENMQMNKS